MSLYIHIPFCERKCWYCDFYSAPADMRQREHYTGLLCRELTAWGALLEGRYRLRTVFIGGGTPTCLSAQLLEKIGKAVRAGFDHSGLVEFTVEANPGTVTEAHVEAFHRIGVNRVSLGLQSTQDMALQRLGRIHSYARSLETYGLLRRAGYDDINIDLMAAIPGQSLSDYRESLEKVIALGPEHISAYSLIVEPGTVFADWQEKGILELPDEETDRAMYSLTGDLLRTCGYERYEISNYARPGRECLHNCVYWTGGEYLGVGENASSCLGGYRFSVPTGMTGYQEYIEKLEWAVQKDSLSMPTGMAGQYRDRGSRETEAGRSLSLPLSAVCGVEKRDQKMQMEEYMFLGLRMMRGVSASEFQRRFGRTMEEVYGETIQKFVRLGLMSLREGGESICLTERGIDVSNQVLAEFLLDEENVRETTDP